MVVTLSLENNKLYQTDSLQFSVSCVNSPTGQCPCPCIYTEDPTCLCRDLRRTVSVGVTKTPVHALYPLSQPRMFHGRPYEVRSSVHIINKICKAPAFHHIPSNAGVHHDWGGR